MNKDRFKFRVWLIKEKKYYYDAEEIYNSPWGENFGDLITNDNCVIEQCTGVSDKNGKLIYEGDIVQYKISGVPTITATVRWSDDAAQFCKDSQSLSSYSKTMVVVGNIHEQGGAK